MKPRAWTVRALSEATGLDHEQVLLSLWEAGIDYPIEPSSRVRAKDARRAEAAVGLYGREIAEVSYWMRRLGLVREELAAVLESYGYALGPAARTLPKGAARTLASKFPVVSENDAVQSASQDHTESSREPEIEVAPPFEWEQPGHIRACDYLTVDELLQVHEALTRDFADSADPISPPGVRSPALLESAAGRPQTSFRGTLKYRTVEAAAAALLHSIVQNHPFHNGNKRTALVSMMVFLDRHGIMLRASQDELFRFMIRVAAHRLLPDGFVYDNLADREVAAIAAFIFTNSRPIRRNERVVTWRELKEKLRAFDCEIRTEGQREIITRRVPIRKKFTVFRTPSTFRTWYLNTGDGREVPKTQLKRIRQALMLDAANGIDSEAFYGDVRGADFFVAEYSTLLRRLAKV